MGKRVSAEEVLSWKEFLSLRRHSGAKAQEICLEHEKQGQNNISTAKRIICWHGSILVLQADYTVGDIWDLLWVFYNCCWCFVFFPCLKTTTLIIFLWHILLLNYMTRVLLSSLVDLGGEILAPARTIRVNWCVSPDKGEVIIVTSRIRNNHVCSQEIGRQKICRPS